MDCLHSQAPNDEELLSYALDGETLPARKQAHLDQCDLCQQRLAGYKQVNASLVSHLYRRLCPDGLQLSLYCENLLPDDEKIRIATHVVDCPLCTKEVAETRRFMREVPLRTSHASSLVEAGRRFIEELLAPSSARRIFATLVRQQAQLVVRNSNNSTNKGWPRQYRAEAIDISLHLSRASNGAYMLLGILTSVDNAETVDAFEGARAELYPAPFERGNAEALVKIPLCEATVDDLGNIVFNAVPIGEYILLIHLPNQNIIIEGITIEHG
ncbi:MAG: anti-sigma factor family protein [Ktedonobacteraceae bacterium]